MAVGTRLRAWRRSAGLTQRELLAGTGLSDSYVSAVERGVITPSLAALTVLAARLGVSVTDLVDPPAAQPAAADQLVRYYAALSEPGRRLLLALARTCVQEQTEVQSHADPGT